MAVYLIVRGVKYHREGIDDVGDIYEIFEGDEAPSGPGYALSDVVEVSTLLKTDVESMLATRRPEILYDEKEDKEYWHDGESGNWYEVVVKPKYELNLANMTLQDRALLANSQTPSPTQIGILGEKIEANIEKYTQNKEVIKPTG